MNHSLASSQKQRCADHDTSETYSGELSHSIQPLLKPDLDEQSTEPVGCLRAGPNTN